MQMKQDEVRYVVQSPVSEVIALHKDVIIQDMYFGEQITKAGIIIMQDDKVDRGIHPRWAKVFAIGPEQKDVKVGQWILVAHGRWTRGIDISINGNDLITIRKVDPKDILGYSNSDPDPKTSCFVSDSALS